jgi:TonB family protein
MSERRAPDYQSRGLLYSLVGHALIFISFFLKSILGANDFGPETVYSVTLEGGAQLGGVSQVPEKNKKENVTPPKPEANKVEPKKEEKKTIKEEVKEEPQAEPEKDAEISTKLEPVATPKPTKKPEPTAKPEKKAEPRKPEPTPKAAEKPKKDETQSKVELDKEYQKAMQRYMGESSDAGGKNFGAGRLGGQAMGGGEQRPPEFFTYRDLIKRTVKKNWNWFDTSTSLRATITFAISPSGEISDVSIVNTSGNSLFDSSVTRAVLKSSPLPPPPANVYQYFRVIRTEFDPQE